MVRYVTLCNLTQSIEESGDRALKVTELAQFALGLIESHVRP